MSSFYSQETGGRLSPARFKLMDEAVKERYDPGQWNIWRGARQTVITGPTIHRCVMRFWRKSCCR